MGTVRRLSAATLCALMLVVAVSGYSEAQLPAANAEIKTVRGRAEVLRKSQSQWAPLAQGARLGEGDQVRTGPGASIDVALPDGSSILVAENTRYVVTRLQYSAGSRERNFGFHVVVGKIKADVSRVAVQAARARQANFFVSTPNGVAAVRGTIVIILFNPATGQTLVAVLPSPGQPPATAVVTFISLATGTVTTITGNNFVTLVPGQPPSAPANLNTLPPAILQVLQTAANTATAGSPLLVATDIEIPPGIQDVVGGEQTSAVITPPSPPPPPTTPGCITPPCP